MLSARKACRGENAISILSAILHMDPPPLTEAPADGGDPTISPLFNFAGLNIFKIKAKVIPADFHGEKVPN